MKITIIILMLACMSGLYFYARPKPIKRVEYLAHWIYIPQFSSVILPMEGVKQDTTPFTLYRTMPEIYTVTLNDGFKSGDTVMVGYKNYYDYTTYIIIQKVKYPVELEISYEQKYLSK